LPAPVGSGWLWSTLLVIALLCFAAGLFGFLRLLIRRPKDADDSEDQTLRRL